MILPTDAASLVLRNRGVDQAIAATVASFAYPEPTWRFALSAARGEELSLRLVTWLHEQGVPEEDFGEENEWTGIYVKRPAMDKAAELGYLSVVQYLSDHSEAGLTHYAMEKAASRGYLGIVKFLFENYEDIVNDEATESACWNGHHEVVKYLHEVANAPFYKRSWELAAGKGDLELIKYLHLVHSSIPDEERNERNVWTFSVMETAGVNAKMEVVQWLHDNRAERYPAESFVQMGGCYGALPFIKFLHEHDYPGDRNAALDNAIERGIQDIAEYLKAQGFTGTAVQ